VKRLGENFESIAGCVFLFEHFGGRGLAGEQEDANIGQQGFHPDGCFDAIQFRHDDVRDEQVRLESGRHFQGLHAGIDRLGFKAALIKDHRKGVGDDPFIVGDQDLWFGGRIRHGGTHKKQAAATCPREK